MRTRNPWIPKKSGKTLGNLDMPQTVSLLLMSYGFYCLINWISDFVGGLRSPRHG